jgi:hypothetical protein
MIKCSPEIVGSIAQHQTDVRVNSGNLTQDELRAIRFNIELGDSEISIRQQSGPLIAQLSDVIFGPFDLKEWASQI